jgi:uncharacterized membrane protein YgdD (TMEM256/DUF423 family)
MCLAHAPVLLGLYLGQQICRTAGFAALALGLGTLVFAADLLSRHYLGDRIFPFAAPIGGMVMIAGWLAIAAGALLRVRDHNDLRI